MTVPELVTSGWLTIDDIVLPNGTYERKVLGGGALYSAVGAGIWNDDVGIHSVAGEVYIEGVRAAIARAGFDTRGINAIPGHGLELWLLHESGSDKQQVPKLASASAEAMDAGRAPMPAVYRDARAFHIAPQGPQGAFATLEPLAARTPRPILTLDLLADAYVDTRRFTDLAFLERLTAFLPSREEVVRLWRPRDLEGWIREQADRFDRILAVKLGEDGSLVCAGAGRPVEHLPALAVEVVDTTGAGDGFCGGFLAGLAGGRPALECAAMATVSASYVVEARGALNTPKPTAAERDARLERLLKGAHRHG